MKEKNSQESQEFLNRHIGPRDGEIEEMLCELKLSSLDELSNQVVPQAIQFRKEFNLPPALSEYDALKMLKKKFSQNKVFQSYIGLGYYGTITPAVIQRNILENPGWYTQYTPYQAEISQGRLEALLHFQTMIADLTGLSIANASLLDEATAAAEAMGLSFAAHKHQRRKFFVAQDCFPQTIEVIQTRAKPLNIEIIIGDHQNIKIDESFFGALVQSPTQTGAIFDYTNFIKRCHEKNCLVTIAADILSLTLLKSPGAMGADIAVGSTQRFGIPMGFGGPHAAYFATKDEFKRLVPGRIVGLSKDRYGKPAVRLALQTREQHIRRERATSNICTSQVLLAIMASMYAVYHGPKGLIEIATRAHRLALTLHAALKKEGFPVTTGLLFDTVIFTTDRAKDFFEKAKQHKMNLCFIDEKTLSVSLDSTTTLTDLQTLFDIFSLKICAQDLFENIRENIPQNLRREKKFMQEKIFNSYHSETEMLRYLHRLQKKDLSLTHSMIPLGSCTMKLNAAAEMFPITWPEVAHLHPFAPTDQTKGYFELFQDLENWFCEMTGFAAFSLQPNAGSQGEYAGLLCIRNYFNHYGDSQRNICLIPGSAHGTNPASAVMAGMKVVSVKCDENGNTDLKDLEEKAHIYKDSLAALMITYPSTHGVFEEEIKTICKIVHDHGGLVYMDGANFNAQIGLCRPADFGADVCHLNLHKTFCIPHGGGGPGVGPIGVTEKLRPFLPGYQGGAVSAAPWGSPAILPISWMYIAMMGKDGLKKASQVAILNANYIAHRLKGHFPVVYKGARGFVAHECIVDLRGFQKIGVTVEDVAKRLIDFGFHAPTMSWPVAGTLMIEPTESESKEELDRFCDAMITIAKEIQEIERGEVDQDDNVLKMAPHTVEELTATNWSHPYSREKAAFPRDWVKTRKFWPAVARVDNAHGDRNLVCTCDGMGWL